jgi:drug/metabolite transporter (DMT)-like permease
MHTIAPAMLAVAAACLIAIGTVLRQRASATSGAITPGWWLGAGLAVTGFGVQAVALGLGSILLVQPLLVLAVLFALPLEAWFDHRRPTRVEWAWGGALTACVALFLCLASPRSTDHRTGQLASAVTIAAVVICLIGLVIAAESCTSHFRALFYGLTAGALFGISALLIKTVINQGVENSATVVVQPEIYLLVVVIGAGIYAQQRGFGSGDLQTSFPAMTVMEPAVAMVLGLALLSERIDVTMWEAGVVAVVLVVMVVAVIELARHSAIRTPAKSGPENVAPEKS